MTKLFLVLLLMTSLQAKYKHQEADCAKLLEKAIYNLNKANKSKSEKSRNAYSNRSLANKEMYCLCIEIHEDYNINKIKNLMKKIK